MWEKVPWLLEDLNIHPKNRIFSSFCKQSKNVYEIVNQCDCESFLMNPFGETVWTDKIHLETKDIK